MSDVKLGEILTGKGERDAVHIAIAPVTAMATLKPGESIGFPLNGDKSGVVPSLAPIGIVDPFLKKPVQKGERFWMFLLPNTITSLRHDWAHPALDNAATTAKVWLTTFAARHRRSFDEMMAILAEARDSGGAWVGNDAAQEDFNDNADEIWDQYEILTAIPTPKDRRRNIYFSCAC